MTYSPGNPGFQSSQQPGSYGPSTPSFAKTADAESKLPLYLQIAVVVLGFGVYLANFGPIVTVTDGEYPLILGDAGHTVPLALLAALLAGVGLLPKAKLYTAVVAVVASLGALLAISTIAESGDSYTIGWGLWLVLTFSILQAAAAVGSLLLEAGVVTAPTPRPKYDPYAQYGLPPGGNYYGQHGYGQQTPQQPGYPSYGGYPSGPSTGGFGAQSAPSTGGFGSGSQQQAPQGPPTPPTGFPSFSQPPAGGSGGSATGGQSGSGQEQSGSGQGQSSTGSQQSQGGSASSGPAQS